jgi:exodeoxyribonuclease VIII
MKHAMIDLETLSTRTDAALLQIGAVAFDPEQNTIDEGGSILLHVDDLDGHIDVDTVKWWLGNHPQKFADISTYPGSKYPLRAALETLQVWMLVNEIEVVWSNGANFDNIILRRKFDQLGMDCPWKYYQERCHRTLVKTAVGFGYARSDEAVEHDALQDALHQAKENIQAYEYLQTLNISKNKITLDNLRGLSDNE